MRRSKWLFILLIVLMGLCLVACGDDDEDDSSDRKKTKEPTETVTDVPASPTEPITGYPAQNPDYDGPGSDGDVTATPTVEPTAELTEVVEPTTEVTPEPTPEVKKDYDPEVVFDSDTNDYRGDMYRMQPKYFGTKGSIFVYTKDSNDIHELDDKDTWKTFCTNNGLYCDEYLNSRNAIMYPIPFQEETMYLTSPIYDTYVTNHSTMTWPSVCVIFVKDGENFNLNDLLAKARIENGEDYTINEMIASEYGNILLWNGYNENGFEFGSDGNDFHEINIKEIFPEEGLYTAYVYRYYEDVQEWHRVDNDNTNRIKYEVRNYDDIGLVLDIKR